MDKTISAGPSQKWDAIFRYMASHVLSSRTAWKFFVLDNAEGVVRNGTYSMVPGLFPALLVPHPLVRHSEGGEVLAQEITTKVGMQTENLIKRMEENYRID